MSSTGSFQNDASSFATQSEQNPLHKAPALRYTYGLVDESDADQILTIDELRALRDRMGAEATAARRARNAAPIGVPSPPPARPREDDAERWEAIPREPRHRLRTPKRHWPRRLAAIGCLALAGGGVTVLVNSGDIDPAPGNTSAASAPAFPISVPPEEVFPTSVPPEEAVFPTSVVPGPEFPPPVAEKPPVITSPAPEPAPFAPAPTGSPPTSIAAAPDRSAGRTTKRPTTTARPPQTTRQPALPPPTSPAPTDSRPPPTPTDNRPPPAPTDSRPPPTVVNLDEPPPGAAADRGGATSAAPPPSCTQCHLA